MILLLSLVSDNFIYRQKQNQNKKETPNLQSQTSGSGTPQLFKCRQLKLKVNK